MWSARQEEGDASGKGTGEREAGTDRHQDRRTESARALCSDKEEGVGYSSETVSRLVLGQKALQLWLRSGETESRGQFVNHLV